VTGGDELEDIGLFIMYEAPLAASVATVVAALVPLVMSGDSEANGEYSASFSMVALAILANSVGMVVAR
jgi:hypothetical protein